MSAKSKKAAYVAQPSSSKSTYILGALALVVIAAVVIGGVIWQSKRSETRNEGYGSIRNAQVQVQVQGNGVTRVGLPTAAKTLDFFEDPLCPACGQFETQYGQEIAQAIDEGKIAVQYHLLDFLNRGSHSGDYSTRAGAAVRCVADGGDPVVFGKFHTELFVEDQPKENGSSDHSNQQLADLAKQAGATDAVQQCVASGAKLADAAANAQTASQDLAALGGRGTPTVFNGKAEVDLRKSDWLSSLG